MTDTGVMQVRIGQLCYQFKLPIMGAQSLVRFTGDAHSDALPTFLEILEQKAKDPRHRASTGCARSSVSPRSRPGRLSNPLAFRQQLDQLAQESFVDRA